MIIKEKLVKFLFWTQKYTQTDMVYAVGGAFWLMVGRSGFFIASFILMLAFANWVPPETFGAYQYVLAVAGTLTIFTLPGINTSIVRSIAKGKEGTLDLAVKTKIRWGMIGLVGLLVVSGYYFLQGNAILGTAFMVAGILLPFRYSYTLLPDFWNGKKRFDLQSKYELFAVGLSISVVVLTLFFTDNLILIVLSYFASHTFFYWVFLRYSKKFKSNDETDDEMVPFGKQLTIMKSAEVVASYLDRIIIWHFLGPVLVAVYSFALLPIQRLQHIIPIAQLALPKLSNGSIHSPDRKKGILLKLSKLFLISVPVSVVLMVAAPIFYPIFFPQYIESIPYFQALSALVIFTPFTLLTTALVADMRNKELYIIKTSTPFFKIVLFLILVPIFGIWGIIYSSIVSTMYASALALFFFKRI